MKITGVLCSLLSQWDRGQVQLRTITMQICQDQPGRETANFKQVNILCYSAVLQCYRVTMLHCYSVAVLQCYNVTVLRSHSVTVLQSHHR